MKKAFFILPGIFFILSGYAQTQSEKEFRKTSAKIDVLFKENTYDSIPYYLSGLKQQVEKLNTDNVKAVYNFYQAKYYRNTGVAGKANESNKKALFYAELAHDTVLQLNALYLQAHYFMVTTNNDSCVFFAERGLLLSKQAHDRQKECEFTFVIGKTLYNQGNLQAATAYYRKSLALAEKINVPLTQIESLIFLAYAYQRINVSFAFTYLKQAEKIVPKIKDKTLISNLYTCTGNCFRETNNFDSSLFYYQKALQLINKDRDQVSYGSAIGNIGNIYSEQGKYDKALEAQYQSIVYFQQANDSADIEIAYGTIADLFLKKKEYNKALDFYKKTIAISERLDLMEELIYNYEGLYKCYEALGNYKEAFAAYKKYEKYNDSLNNIDNAKKLTEQDLKYKFDVKEREQAILQKSKDELTHEQLKRQQIIITCSVLGAAVILFFLGITLRNSNIRKKTNTMLQQSHTEIALQKDIIENKNREITDSITYASRLQQGVLPDETDIQHLLPGSFIFYKPRDIVSGDFYWMKKVTGSVELGFGDLISVAVADCTGHGVPGAFMSFIGSTILNQTLGNDKVKTPADALYYLNEQLPLTLQSKKQTGQINDGMEAGICVIDKQNKNLFFAGANLDLIHIRNKTVTCLKGDKHAIGIGSHDQHKNFTNYQLKLQSGDSIYMFSDGYADQFGGPKGKKFKYKNLIELLKENSTLLPDKQSQKLDEVFSSWKSNIEQIDDVMVFGYIVS